MDVLRTCVLRTSIYCPLKVVLNVDNTWTILHGRLKNIYKMRPTDVHLLFTTNHTNYCGQYMDVRKMRPMENCCNKASPS